VSQPPTHAITLLVSAEVQATIEAAARRADRDVASVAAEMLSEAAKMRRVPGIVFADGVRGRVPQIAGTGLEVWEVVERYQAVGESWELLKEEFDWLSEQQLRTALTYAAAYPEEIAERLQADERWTPDTLYAAHPFMKPPAP
jgi:uncharacterized protein (DUF433 family)